MTLILKKVFYVLVIFFAMYKFKETVLYVCFYVSFSYYVYSDFWQTTYEHILYQIVAQNLKRFKFGILVKFLDQRKIFWVAFKTFCTCTILGTTSLSMPC